MHQFRFLLLGLGLLCAAPASFASQFTFSVSNESDQDIAALAASQDGSDWRKIRVDGGIPAHSMTELRWNSKEDRSVCVWQVKAQFDRGGESTPVEFDFCAADRVLSLGD